MLCKYKINFNFWGVEIFAKIGCAIMDDLKNIIYLLFKKTEYALLANGPLKRFSHYKRMD